jgi:hypothetical protein
MEPLSWPGSRRGIRRRAAPRRCPWAAWRSRATTSGRLVYSDPDSSATNGGWALGGERFKREIAEAFGRRVAPLPLGRPAKPRDDKRQISLL